MRDEVIARVEITNLNRMAALAESLNLICEWDDADLTGNPKFEVVGPTSQVVRFLVERPK